MTAKRISLKNAKKEKLFYFVVNIVVYRESDKKCLILKRDIREKVHPGKYGVIGGKLEWNDLDTTKPTRINGDVLDFENAVEDLAKREAYEEAGIEIYPDLKYINSVAFIRPDETPVIMTKFAAKYKNGEVRLEKGAFTDFKWVDEKDVVNLPCIQGIPDEVKQTIRLFNPT